MFFHGHLPISGQAMRMDRVVRRAKHVVCGRGGRGQSLPDG